MKRTRKQRVSLAVAAMLLFGTAPTVITAETADSAASFVCRFYDASGDNLYFSGIQPGTVTAKAGIYSEASGTYQLTAGLYQESRLVSVSCKTVIATGGTEAETDFTFTIPEAEYQDYAVKVFCTDSYSSLHPIREAVVLDSDWSNSFFDSVQLSELSSDIQSDQHMKAMAANLQTQAVKDQSSSTPYVADAIAGRRLQINALFLMMNGYLTQNETQLAKGIWFLTESAKETDVAWANTQNEALAVGDMLMAYAVGYDWAKPFLSAYEDYLLRAEIEEYGAWLYNQATKSTPASWAKDTAACKSWNWSAVCFGSLGLAALSLSNHADWLSLAKSRSTDYLTNAMDVTGYAREGASYISHGLHFVLAFAQAYQTRTGNDIFQDAVDAAQNDATTADPRNLIDYFLYLRVPSTGQMLKINQSDGFAPGDSILSIIMKTKSAEGLYAWLKAYGSEGDGSYGQGSWPGVGASLPFILLNYDKTLEPKATDESRDPVKRFSTGGLAARTGWGELDALLTVNAGGRRGTIWNHADAGSITFSALGETFITDLGPGKIDSSYHSLVLIDGLGQSLENKSGKTYNSSVETYTYEPTDEFIFYDVDLIKAYNIAHTSPKCSLARRQIFYRLGDQPYVVIVDRITKKTSTTYPSYVYDSRLIVDADASAEQDGSAVTLTGAARGAKCLVQYLAPGSGALSVTQETGYQRIDYTVTDTQAVFVSVLCPYEATEAAPTASINEAGDTITIMQGERTEQLSLSDSSIALLP